MDLAQYIVSLFSQAEADRRDVEERWLQDLRQYKGMYDPEVESRLHPRRSRAYIRLTRAKVRSIDARLSDLLFPGTGEKNWSLAPTPVPDLAFNTAQAVSQAAPRGIGERAMRGVALEAARQACERMSQEIEDQLDEAGYAEIIRDVLHSGNLYGTGVLKGPLVAASATVGWAQRDGKWRPEPREHLRPYIEFVPVWDLYPDMSASSIARCRYVFQRHRFTKSDLADMAEREDFFGESIQEYLRTAPQGDVCDKNHEAELRGLSDAPGAARNGNTSGRYEILEFWGYASGELIAPFFPHVEFDMARDYRMNAYVLGQSVVKLVFDPISGDDWPYYFYYYEKDETGIFGEGAARIMRDPQLLFNASIRAMLDNAAICAGPQIEVNQDLLPENEDPTDIHPFRVWLRSGAGLDSQYPAVRVSTMPSYTQEFLTMAEMFSTYIHETTAVPKLNPDDFSSPASQTMRGLSMLMGAAGVTLKDQVRLFDEGITKPFLTALYHWNMALNSRPDIKGDFSVKPLGWTSLVAKEIFVEQLDSFAKFTTNELDAPYINRGELLRRMAASRNLGHGIVKSEDEVEAMIAASASASGAVSRPRNKGKA